MGNRRWYWNPLWPFCYLGGLLMIAGFSWFSAITTHHKQPAYITNPQTAGDFVKRCKKQLRHHKDKEALSDCNVAVSLDNTLSEAYFARSAARHRLGDKEGGTQDYYHGRSLMMERNKRRAEEIFKNRRSEK